MKVTQKEQQQLIKLAFSKSSIESLEKIIKLSPENSFNKIEAQKAFNKK